MTDAERTANEVLAHSEDEGEWDDQPEQLEVRPSGTQVISARLPTALAEELLAEVARRGVRPSELVRQSVDRPLHPQRPDTGTALAYAFVNAFMSERLSLVTPLLQYRTENSNPVVEPAERLEPPLLVTLGFPRGDGK
ncbi:MAG TPA: hypothetical protein VG317_10790 [Pseudonocardiaceae bacterium]|nr:hypothetical protein [Pseudonocardiaceae bacterium]